VRLRYPDVETFIEKFSVNVSRGGIFIRTREPRPVGTNVRFEFQLQDGTPVFRGEGEVVWVREHDPSEPSRAHGMGLKFARLDRSSRALIDRILEHKSKREREKREGELTADASSADTEALVDAMVDDGEAPPAPAAEEGPSAETAGDKEAALAPRAGGLVGPAEPAEPAADGQAGRDVVGPGRTEGEALDAAGGPAAEPAPRELDESRAAGDLGADAERAERELAEAAAEPVRAAPSTAASGEAVGPPAEGRPRDDLVRAVRHTVERGGGVDELLELPVSADAMLSMALPIRPVEPAALDAELDALEPEGFSTAAAIERLLGRAVAPEPEVATAPAMAQDEVAAIPVDAPLDAASAPSSASLAELELQPQEVIGPGVALDQPVVAASVEDVEAPPAEPTPDSEQAGAPVWSAVGEEENLLSDGQASDSLGGLFGSEEIPGLLDDLLSTAEPASASMELGGGAGPDLELDEEGASADTTLVELPPAGPSRAQAAPHQELWPEVEARVLVQGAPAAPSGYRGEPIMPDVDVDIEIDSPQAQIDGGSPTYAPPAAQPHAESLSEADYDGLEEAEYAAVDLDTDGTLVESEVDLAEDVDLSATPIELQPPPVSMSMPRTEADDVLDELFAEIGGKPRPRAEEVLPDLFADDDPGASARRRAPTVDELTMLDGEHLVEDEGGENGPTVTDRFELDAAALPAEHEQLLRAARGETKMGVPLRQPPAEPGMDDATQPTPRFDEPLGEAPLKEPEEPGKKKGFFRKLFGGGE
jgi:uncharacterized protein (TIGR02266 family)